MEEKQGQNEKRLQCTVVRDLEPHKGGDDGGGGEGRVNRADEWA